MEKANVESLRDDFLKYVLHNIKNFSITEENLDSPITEYFIRVSEYCNISVRQIYMPSIGQCASMTVRYLRLVSDQSDRFRSNIPEEVIIDGKECKLVRDIFDAASRRNTKLKELKKEKYESTYFGELLLDLALSDAEQRAVDPDDDDLFPY